MLITSSLMIFILYTLEIFNYVENNFCIEIWNKLYEIANKQIN